MGDPRHGPAYGIEVELGARRHVGGAFGRELGDQGVGAHVLEDHCGVHRRVVADIDQRHH